VEKRSLGNLGVDRRIIVQRIVKKEYWGLNWTVVAQNRIGWFGLTKTGIEKLCSIKCG
jgi:hypothetical protein